MIQRPSCFVPTSVFFFFTCLCHGPSFSPSFITILFRLQSGQSAHYCLYDHIYFLLKILLLLHSVEDQIHLPKSHCGGRGGTLSLHHCLSRPLTCKHILQSFSTLGLYPPTEKSIYNQRWVFFFFFFLLCIWSYWTIYGTTLGICWGKRIYTTLLHDVEVTWSTTCSCNLFTPSHPACALSWVFYLHFVKDYCRINPDIWFNGFKRTESSDQFQIYSHLVSHSQVFHLSQCSVTVALFYSSCFLQIP